MDADIFLGLSLAMGRRPLNRFEVWSSHGPVGSRAEAARLPVLRRSRLHEEPGCRCHEIEELKADRLPNAELQPRQARVRDSRSARRLAACTAHGQRG